MAKKYSDTLSLDAMMELSAGSILKAFRESQEVEIEVLSRKLYIRIDYLEALEASDYLKLGDLVYILGFARNVALELKIDPQLIAKKIKDELNLDIDERYMTPPAALQRSVAPSGRAAHTSAGDHKPMSYLKPKGELNKLSSNKSMIERQAIALLAGVGMIVRALNPRAHPVRAGILILLIGGALTFGIMKAHRTIHPSFEVPITIEYGPENKDVGLLAIQAEKEAWVKIENTLTRDFIFSRLMQRGDIYYLPKVTDNLQMSISQGGQVQLYEAGHQLGTPVGSETTFTIQVPLTKDGFLTYQSEVAASAEPVTKPAAPHKVGVPKEVAP